MTRPAETERRVRLSQWARAVCWTFGVGFGAAGSVAVFTTENQAGTAALLILSALFSIIALTGRVPHRLQFGENTVEWPQEVADAVAIAIEEGPPEVAERVVSAIAETVPDRIISIATDRLTGATAERLAQATLMLATIQLEAETDNVFTVLRLGVDGMFDLEVVRGKRNKASIRDDTLPVIVKRVALLRVDFIRRLAEYTDTSALGKVMVILYGELAEHSDHVLVESPNVYLAQVDGSFTFEEAIDKIKQCLRAAFSLGLDPTAKLQR